MALGVRPLLEPWGFAAVVDVTPPARKDIHLTWQVDKARFVSDQSDHPEFAAAKFARFFVGTAGKDSRVAKRALRVDLTADPAAPRRSRLLCVWGYSDYNKQGVPDV